MVFCNRFFFLLLPLMFKKQRLQFFLAKICREKGKKQFHRFERKRKNIFI